MVTVENKEFFEDEFGNRTDSDASEEDELEKQDRLNMKEAIKNAEKSRRYLALLTAKVDLGLIYYIPQELVKNRRKRPLL